MSPTLVESSVDGADRRLTALTVLVPRASRAEEPGRTPPAPRTVVVICPMMHCDPNLNQVHLGLWLERHDSSGMVSVRRRGLGAFFHLLVPGQLPILLLEFVERTCLALQIRCCRDSAACATANLRQRAAQRASQGEFGKDTPVVSPLPPSPSHPCRICLAEYGGVKSGDERSAPMTM
jgi:hypothetical protein